MDLKQRVVCLHVRGQGQISADGDWGFNGYLVIDATITTHFVVGQPRKGYSIVGVDLKK